jgi:hypothetical protein
VDTDSLVGASTFGSTSREWLQWSDDPGRVVARFSTAAAASAALCLMLWAMVPRSLSGEIDIVGYPTFANYDHRPAFWAYRLVVYAFPLLLITFYAIIARLGPLRRRPRPTSTGSIRMLEPPSIRRPPDPSSFRFGVIPRLALPLAVVVTAAGTRTGQTRGFAAMCGLVYLLAILAVGVLSSFAASRGESRTGKAAFWDGVALANGAGGTACCWTRHGASGSTSREASVSVTGGATSRQRGELGSRPFTWSAITVSARPWVHVPSLTSCLFHPRP